MNLCNSDECTGCLVCKKICPKNAIETVYDKKCFAYPEINVTKCIDCGLCNKVCPVLNYKKKLQKNVKVYACWSRSQDVRRNSASGGLFIELANTVLNNGGNVFGAAFDEDFGVKHIMIESQEDLYKLQGSKYVQSSIIDTYEKVVEELNKKKVVLYTGTPCQIAALSSYVQQKKVNIEKLFTCDLICHGIPSPRFWKSYINDLERKYKSKLIKYNFRYKNPGWMVYSAKADFANGKTYLCNTNKDKYSRAFLYDYIIRENCQRCPYTNTNRVSDITMADFWGYQDNEEYSDDDKGISLAIVNTEKGRWLFEETKSNMVFIEKTLQEAVNGNRSLSKPWPANPNTDLFWKDYFSKGYRYVCWKYLKPVKQSEWKNKWRTFKYDLKVLPNRVLLTILGKDNYNRLKDKLKK